MGLGGWLQQTGKLTALNSIMIEKISMIHASSELGLSLYTIRSFKTCQNEAIRSDHTLKTGWKISEPVHFEDL